MAGNGNSGKRKDKLFHSALMLELTQAEDGRGLRQIARNVIEKALNPDDKDMLAAANVIADRIDGKVPQGVALGNEQGEDGAPTELLIRVIKSDRS